MHIHADHPLFLGRPGLRPGRRLWVALGALLLNAWSPWIELSLALALAGGVLLLSTAATGAGRQRLGTWLLLMLPVVGLAALASLWVSAAGAIAARMVAGMSWLLWLGLGLDWPALRGLLARLPASAELVSTLDRSLLHGLLIFQAWKDRRWVARLRLGRPRIPLGALGTVLGEGLLQGVERAARAEETAGLRSAASSEPGAGEVHFRGVTVVSPEGVGLLNDIELSIPSGTWVAICGLSGAGKTTLLRTLAGALPLAGGTLWRLGRRIEATTPLAERLDGRVGLLTQNPEHHFLASTVQEDVAWGLIHRGVPRALALEQAHQALVELGLGTFAARACHSLSFGEQRRVALAGLLVHRPELLLLDEPTAGLDPRAVGRMQAMLSAGAATVLWATHDLDHLPPHIRRVLLVQDGRIVFDGPREAGLSPTRLRALGLAPELTHDP